MFTCLDCETNIDIDENIAVGDTVQCTECELKMKVLSTEPPTVDYLE